MWRRGEKGFYAEMMDHLGELLLMNLLWFLACIPIVTAGAATVALHRVCFDLLEEGGKATAGSFWRYFKEAFCSSTILWLFFLFAAADMALLVHMAGIISLEQLLENPFRTAPIIILIMVYWFVVNWSFPLAAYSGDCKICATVKTSFAMAVSFPAKTFLCIGITVFMVLLSILCPLVLLGTGSCTSYLICRVVRPAFRQADRWMECENILT